VEYIASHLFITLKSAGKNHENIKFVVKVNRGGTRAPAGRASSKTIVRCDFISRFSLRVPTAGSVLIRSEGTFHGRTGTLSRLRWIPLPYRLDRSICRQASLNICREGEHT